MKKVFLALFLVAISVTGTFAQAFDFGLNLGYGARTAGSGYFYSQSGNTTTYRPISLGAGFNIGINGVMWFGDHVGAGLDLTYVTGSRTIDTGSNGVANKISGSVFNVTPMVLLSAHNEGVNPYAKFGIAFGFPSSETDATVSSVAVTDKFSGGVAIGFFAAFGLDFPISDNLIFNAEIFDRAMAWEPTKEVYSVGGFSTTTTWANSINTNSPPANTTLTTSMPLSSVGILVGIKFRMANK